MPWHAHYSAMACSLQCHDMLFVACFSLYFLLSFRPIFLGISWDVFNFSQTLSSGCKFGCKFSLRATKIFFLHGLSWNMTALVIFSVDANHLCENNLNEIHCENNNWWIRLSRVRKQWFYSVESLWGGGGGEGTGAANPRIGVLIDRAAAQPSQRGEVP